MTGHEEISTEIENYANVTLHELGTSPLTWCLSSPANGPSLPHKAQLTNVHGIITHIKHIYG